MKIPENLPRGTLIKVEAYQFGRDGFPTRWHVCANATIWLAFPSLESAAAFAWELTATIEEPRLQVEGMGDQEILQRRHS